MNKNDKNNQKIMQKHGTHYIKLGLMLLVMVFTSLACISGINLGDQPTIEVKVSVSENAINRRIRHSFLDNGDDDLFDEITSIDFQSNLIRVFGLYRNSEGSEVAGSADVSFYAEDGKLNAEIIAVDVIGLDINHSRVTHINNVLAQVFSEEVSENDDVEFLNVIITEDAMEITIRVSVE